MPSNADWVMHEIVTSEDESCAPAHLDAAIADIDYKIDHGLPLSPSEMAVHAIDIGHADTEEGAALLNAACDHLGLF